MSIKKIVVIGPESTGKSTLSEALANALHTLWVPEYAREYLDQLGRPYTKNDLLQIAMGQLANEDELAKKASKILVCDTDLNVIKVWSNHNYGHCAPEILKEIAQRKYDLYLLTGIDIPWEYDPLREHEAVEMRQYFYSTYKNICQNSGVPFFEINGNPAERLHQAILAVNNIK